MIDRGSEDEDASQDDQGRPSDRLPAALGPLRAIAALGDGAVLLAFAAIGRASHHRDKGGPIWGVLGTAAPFLIGWYVAALPLGAYRPQAFAGHRSSAIYTARSWLNGGGLGLALRSLLERHVVPASFAAITLGFNLTLFLAWRASLVELIRRLSDES